MPTYSASRLSTYEQCPRRFRFRYIDKISREEEQTIEAFTGKLVHDALETLYKDLHLGTLRPKDAVLAYFEAQWKKQWDDGVTIVRENVTPEQYKDLGLRCLARYYDHYAPFDQGETLGLEARIAFPLDDEGRYSIEGYIDRLARGRDGALEIHDYKTGSGNLPSRSNLHADRQLALYNLGVRKEYGNGKPVRAVWHFLAFDEEIVIEHLEEELAEVRQGAVSLIRTIETDTEFPTAKSLSLCPWCEYRDICPAMRHEEKLDALTPIEALADRGRALVDEYMRLKEDLDALEKGIAKEKERIEGELAALKAAISDYAKKEGLEMVTGTKHRIRVKWYPAVEFPDWQVREEVAALLAQEGRLMDVAGVDSKRLARAIMDRTLPEDLARKITSKVSVGLRPYLYPSKR